ncbi:hypothetical protein ACJIZ3_023156 [Penstemon smallii]|uniref:Uncharacterized protein n=1 Tax=Penstemon smallii TaxID=265156 RepID=A0ABD3TNG5_9LAMI
MSPPSDTELEERLNAAGTRLLRPPSSIDELLSLLDGTEDLLSKVEQSPAKSMHTALNPLMKALVAEDLMKHSDVDVKVGVASCISEITRITAPDAPYDDGKMKDVFQLIVSSFENMSDTSSRSHKKRATILETVAKVRSCVIMLDLECDQMIVEMFQHFLKDIRDNHEEVIFASMETIMTLVIEESEDISPDLLNPILAILERNNEAVLPIAKKLTEKVIQSCADKLRPYLIEAVRTLDASLDDYSEVVASVCRENTGTGGLSNENISKDEPYKSKNDPAESSDLLDDEKQAEQDREIVGEEVHSSPNEVPPVESAKSLDKVSDNGIQLSPSEAPENEDVNVASPTQSDSLPEENHSKYFGQAKRKEILVGEEADSADTASKKVSEGENISEEDKQHEEVNVVSPTRSGSLSEENQSKNSGQTKRKKKLVDEVADSADSASKTVSEGENMSEAKKPKQKQSKNSGQAKRKEYLVGEEADSADTASKKVSEDENISEAKKQKQKQSKNSGQAKRKQNLVGEEADSADTSSKKVSEGENISEAKKQKQKQKQRSARKRPGVSTNKDKALTEEGASKNDGGSSSDSGTKSLDQTQKLVDASNKAKNGPPSKKESRKKSGRVNKDKISIEEVASKNDGGSTSDDTRSLDQTEKLVDSLNKADGGSQSRKEDRKKSGRVKPKPEKDVLKSSAIEDDKEMVNSPSSPLKSTKYGSNKEETPKINTKRKRTPGTEKASEIIYGENLVGSKVKVWWPDDQEFYSGVIESFDSGKKHKVLYNDGEVEVLDLRKEKWEFVGDELDLDEDQAVEHASSDMKRKNKATPSSEASTEPQSKDKYSKSIEESEDETITIKSKDRLQKHGGKSHDDSGKASGKSKDIDVGKASSHSKQDSQKTAKSKGKTPQTGKTSDAKGAGKSSSSKVKETDRMKEKLMDSEKLSEMGKGKSPDIAKLRESETKSGKKRRR